MKYKATILCGVMLLGLLGASVEAAPITSALYASSVDPIMMTEIGGLFPRRGNVAPAFVDPQVDPNLYLLVDSVVSITFIGETSRRRNTLGWFTYDRWENILSTGTIFPNASAAGSRGSLAVGDTVDLGPVTAGTSLGFYMIRNGYRRPGGTRYYSVDSLNAGGQRRVAMTGTRDGNYTVFGFEDRRRLRGVLDYNDLVFGVSTSPILLATVTNPEPGTATLLALGFGFIGASRILRRRAERTKK